MRLFERDSKQENILKAAILSNFNSLDALRSTTIDKRVLAAKLVGHRNTNEADSIWNNDYPILDTMPKKAVRTLVNGLMGNVMSPSLVWFRFNSINKSFYPTDHLFGASDYLEKCQQSLLYIFSATAYYSSMKMALTDALVTGTGFLLTIDDQDNNKLYYRCQDPQEMYIGEDYNQIVNTVFRKYTLTTKQSYEAYGDNLPASIINDYKTGVNSIVSFLDCIYPEGSVFDPSNKTRIKITQKKYAHIIYCFTGGSIVSESGYDEIPYSIFRYSRETSKHAYGIGIMMELIPDILRLQDFSRISESAAQQQSDPTMFYPFAWKEHGIDTAPGAKNFVKMDSTTGVPYATNRNIQVTELDQKIYNLENYIYEAAGAKLFDILMQTSEIQQTATWVNEIKGEALVLMSSTMDTLQLEMIQPSILRTFNILRRNGNIPPMPKELQNDAVNGQVRIELEGPLIKRMRSFMEAQGITNGLVFIKSVLEANPNATVNIDWDELLRQGASSQGLPQSIIREYADVQKIKQQQLDQEQAKAKQEQALQQSVVNKNTGGASVAN